MASTGLSKTFSGAGTNNKKGTISFWLKRSGISSAQSFGLQTAGAGGGTAGLYFDSSDTLYFYLAYTSGSWKGLLRTNRKFRDTNAWYHFVVAWDTTQATESNRLKLYVNGVQETSFSTENYPPQDQATTFGNAQAHYINYSGSSNYFDGVMSHFYYTDGYTYAASDFGSTDSTTGEWKINTSPSVTYGTNGFLILKDGMTITDQSSNSNDFTLATGTLTKTEDCPSNVFATYNSLQNLNDNNILSNGNTTQKETSTVGQRQAICNIGGFTGKYYAEFKMINLGPQNGSSPYCGVLSMSNYDNDTYLGNNGIAMHPGGNIYRSASVIDSQTSITYTTNSIVSVALDITNNKCHFRVNGGSWLGSGDPVNNTGGYDISSLNTGDGMTFASSVFNNNCQWSVNFGNGYFGTTAVSSAGTNASNNGIFEYDVPTGYTALSTKGLNL